MKIDFDFNEMDFQFTGDKEEYKTPDSGKFIEAPCPKSYKKKSKNVYRKAYSETQLFDILGIKDLQDGYSYHCISGGDIDSLSYIKYILRQQNLEYLLFSTWCMAQEDVKQINIWIAKNNILRLDAYMGEIFPGSYKEQYKELCRIIKKNRGRVCIARNHSKIYAGIGSKYAFAIESSANINTNPRIENTTITIGKDIYCFYKNFFDKLISFTKDFDDWVPYENSI